MSYILACDLGSTSLRVALVDESGEIRFMAAGPGPAMSESAASAETDIDRWWAAFVATVETLAERSGPAFADVRAIAISGVTRTQIYLGRDGRPLRPAMTWADRRAASVGSAMAGLMPAGHPERTHINPFHPAARLFWLSRNEPGILPALAGVLEPKDYFNARLTGRPTTDAISSARLIASARADGGGRSLLAALGLPEGIVPELVAPGEIVGRVRDDHDGALGRLAGCPVLGMAHDTWTSVLGLGALREGFAYNLSGTTEVLGAFSRTPFSADGLMSVQWGPDTWQLGGPSQNGADTLAWALELLGRRAAGRPVGEALDALLAGRRDAQPLLFLPYLQGERTPYWDPDLRGAFVGLNRHHGPVDCAFAVLEGIAFLNRIVLDRAEAATGQPVAEIRFGGGGAANAVWCQIKADICERPIVTTACPEPGLLGAAIVGWTALGGVPSLTAGQDRLAAVARRYEPRATPRDGYRRLFDLFRRAEGALAPISRALAKDGDTSHLRG